MDLCELSAALDAELLRLGGGQRGGSASAVDGSPSPASPPSLLRLTLCSGAKVQHALSVVSRLRRQRPEDKAVVFSVFTRMLDCMEVALASLEEVGPTGYRRFDGSMTAEAQQRSLAAFHTQPASQLSVLLISLQAGGVGLSLTAANHCLMLDGWWAPALEGQAYDRIHRLSQRKDVVIHRLFIQDSVEDRLRQVQRDKGALSSELMQDPRAAAEEEEEEEEKEEEDEQVGEGGAAESAASQRSATSAPLRQRRQPQGFSLRALQQLFDVDEEAQRPGVDGRSADIGRRG